MSTFSDHNKILSSPLLEDFYVSVIVVISFIYGRFNAPTFLVDLL